MKTEAFENGFKTSVQPFKNDTFLEWTGKNAGFENDDEK